MMDDIAGLEFEAALIKLESVVHRLEAEELSLEESITLFERGQALLKHCQEILSAAELRVQQIIVDDV